MDNTRISFRPIGRSIPVEVDVPGVELTFVLPEQSFWWTFRTTVELENVLKTVPKLNVLLKTCMNTVGMPRTPTTIIKSETLTHVTFTIGIITEAIPMTCDLLLSRYYFASIVKTLLTT